MTYYDICNITLITRRLFHKNLDALTFPGLFRDGGRDLDAPEVTDCKMQKIRNSKWGGAVLTPANDAAVPDCA